MSDRRSTRSGHLWFLGVMGLALSACGADPAQSTMSPELDTVEIAPVDATTDSATADGPGHAADTAPAPTAQHRVPPTPAHSMTAAEFDPVPQQQELDQPAIWPAADIVFSTPEDAAADFVTSVLISEGDALLGEFQQGDARSGEIAVLFAGEGGDLDPPSESGTLVLRQIGPTDGWYVIAAMSDGVTIDTPSALDEVPAGTLRVSGEGRGFEGTLAVSAFPPGDIAGRFDLQIGAGGAVDELEPYSVELDLSGAVDGDVVVILVRGDTGLETDPSTFAALPVRIEPGPAVTLPPTR